MAPHNTCLAYQLGVRLLHLARRQYIIEQSHCWLVVYYAGNASEPGITESVATNSITQRGNVQLARRAGNGYPSGSEPGNVDKRHQRVPIGVEAVQVTCILA